MSSPSTPLPTPTGPGSVSGAPSLPDGFADTFTSRFVDTNGVRLHVVVGGDGPPLLLVHGWPESWYAWRLVMPALARDFHVVAVDQRGMGLSDKAPDGYDTGTLAADLAGAMEALGHERFAVVGHDTGMVISYALAADHRERVARFVAIESPLPGVTPSPPLFVPQAANHRIWHIAFNREAVVNEQLVRGREDIFFGFEFESATVTKLPAGVVQYYVDHFAADPGALRSSFGFYRAVDETLAQNEHRKEQPLPMPVLAIGGARSTGENIAKTMQLTADSVEGLVIPDCGHFVAEESPDALLSGLTEFLAPYLDDHEMAS